MLDMFQFFYPARGRKPCNTTVNTETSNWFQFFTPQGDGNNPGFRPEPHSKHIVSIFLPRKGTETAEFIIAGANVGFNFFTPQGDGNKPLTPSMVQTPFQFFYPARGRKLSQSYLRLSRINWFQFFYPARGRKRSTIPPAVSTVKCFNFFTPQGDGNPKALLDVKIWNIVSIFLPRKGTETTTVYGKPSSKARVSIFLPRKGTETFESEPESTSSGFNFFTPQGDGN